jgi:hypothetical protein
VPRILTNHVGEIFDVEVRYLKAFYLRRRTQTGRGGKEGVRLVVVVVPFVVVVVVALGVVEIVPVVVVVPLVVAVVVPVRVVVVVTIRAVVVGGFVVVGEDSTHHSPQPLAVATLHTAVLEQQPSHLMAGKLGAPLQRPLVGVQVAVTGTTTVAEVSGEAVVVGLAVGPGVMQKRPYPSLAFSTHAPTQQPSQGTAGLPGAPAQRSRYL